MQPLVGFLTNIYTPYKEPLLSALSSQVRLKVYYCALREPNRKWDLRLSGTYNYEVLKGLMLRVGGVFLHVNPGIIGALRRDRPAVVIVGGYSYPTVMVAPFVCRWLGIPTILWSGSTHLEHRRSRFLWQPLKRFLIRRYDAYVAYTSRAAQYLEHLGAPHDKICVAPVTVDTSFFSDRADALRSTLGRPPVRARFGWDPDDVVLIFVGQCIHRKGGDVLIRAAAALNDRRVKLAMVGDGPLRAEWEALGAELGLAARVSWLGHVSQETLVELYVAGDIMVLPSRQDPSGNVINEAMATGLPVVISDSIGTDVVRPGLDGYILPAGDAPELARHLRRLVVDPAARAAMGVSAREQIQHFSIDDEARQFAAAVRSVLPVRPQAS